METEIVTEGTGSGKLTTTPEKGSVDPDDLKRMVRDGLTALTLAERVSFILAVERELRAVHLSMRSYLVPIGISANSPIELTPGDVGHLIRFLKISVPSAKRVVDRVAELFAFSPQEGKVEKPADRVAA